MTKLISKLLKLLWIQLIKFELIIVHCTWCYHFLAHPVCSRCEAFFRNKSYLSKTKHPKLQTLHTKLHYPHLVTHQYSVVRHTTTTALLFSRWQVRAAAEDGDDDDDDDGGVSLCAARRSASLPPARLTLVSYFLIRPNLIRNQFVLLRNAFAKTKEYLRLKFSWPVRWLFEHNFNFNTPFLANASCNHHHHHHFIVTRHDRTHTKQERYSETSVN